MAEVSGAVVVESIEEVGAPVLSTERAAVARPEDRWAAVWHEDRPEVPQYAVRWAAAPPWVRPEVLQYGGRGEVVPPWARAGVRQYAGQWVAAPLSGRRAMLPRVGLRATSRSVIQMSIADHIRTFTAAPIMVTAPPRRVLR